MSHHSFRALPTASVMRVGGPSPFRTDSAGPRATRVETAFACGRSWKHRCVTAGLPQNLEEVVSHGMSEEVVRHGMSDPTRGGWMRLGDDVDP